MLPCCLWRGHCLPHVARTELRRGKEAAQLPTATDVNQPGGNHQSCLQWRGDSSLCHVWGKRVILRDDASLGLLALTRGI